jgi:hypothetical protein
VQASTSSAQPLCPQSEVLPIPLKLVKSAGNEEQVKWIKSKEFIQASLA